MGEMTTLPDLDVRPIETEIVETTDADDDPDCAHIVSQRDLIHSQITGEPIRALCGKLWVPKRDPDNYPLCQACVEIFNSLA